MIDDPRFSIVRPYIKEWNLHIREVRRADSGQYRCTINTEPVITRIFSLYVKGETYNGTEQNSFDELLFVCVAFKGTTARKAIYNAMPSIGIDEMSEERSS